MGDGRAFVVALVQVDDSVVDEHHQMVKVAGVRSDVGGKREI